MGIPLTLRTGPLSLSPSTIARGRGLLNTHKLHTNQMPKDKWHNLITEMVALNPDFKPSADYKPPTTCVSDKIMIVQDAYPEINFMGLLIGPRGDTLKNTEKEYNTKVLVWEKGSVKEGKAGHQDDLMLCAEGESFLALVTTSSIKNVKNAVEQIRNILKQGIETPEDWNDLWKMQLQ